MLQIISRLQMTAILKAAATTYQLYGRAAVSQMPVQVALIESCTH